MILIMLLLLLDMDLKVQKTFGLLKTLGLQDGEKKVISELKEEQIAVELLLKYFQLLLIDLFIIYLISKLIFRKF